MSGKQKSRKKRPAPKLRVPPHDVDALNRSFYAADPADYFERRLQNLILQMASTDAANRSDERQAAVGGLQMTIPSIEVEPPDERNYQAFLLIESESVKHHLSETLLRMFFAHNGASACPWIRISEVRSPGEFKTLVARFVRNPTADVWRKSIGMAFFGHGEPSGVVITEDSWPEVLERMTGFLIAAAETVLNDNDVYNAVKHGLVVQAGESAFKLGEEPLLQASGPSIAVLERHVDAGVASVRVKNRWQNLPLDLAIDAIHIRMLRGMWNVGCGRHMGHVVRTADMFIPPATFEEVRRRSSDTGERPPVELTSMSFPPAMFCPPGAGADALRRDRAAGAGNTP